MTTQKKERQAVSLEQAAASYREKMLAIKDLEKQAAPLKKLLTDHARALGVDSVEISGVTLEKRVTVKAEFSPEAFTPDLLDRLQLDGYSDLLKLSVDAKTVKNQLPDDRLTGYLNEIGYVEKENTSYAVRI